MTTKPLNLTYWITTSSFCLMMAASGVLYLTSVGLKERFAHLGFPSYFRVELALLKLAGVVVLLLPFPRFLKEWAFAGFLIVLTKCRPLRVRIETMTSSEEDRGSSRSRDQLEGHA